MKNAHMLGRKKEPKNIVTFRNCSSILRDLLPRFNSIFSIFILFRFYLEPLDAVLLDLDLDFDRDRDLDRDLDRDAERPRDPLAPPPPPPPPP